MKCTLVFAFFALLVSASAVVDSSTTGDRTITKVVKILQNMMEKSKAEGDEERTLFGKFKCYCDSNELKKKASIADLTKQIGLLESQIGELQGSTGGLSSECAQLRTGMMDNEAARAEADSIRKKANEAFVAEEADLKQAIGQMDDAISTLASVGADQTLGNAAADHAKFMAKGSSLLELKGSVKQALTAASAFLGPKQVRTVQSFIQAPFTGSYTSQSAEILGILKSMRDTFKQNLANAIATEAAQLTVFTKLTETKEKEYAMMKAEYDDKQASLGSNDDDLSAKKTTKADAESTKADDEEFLAKLIVMCEDKTKDYEDRKMMRANEQAAVAQAISILDSDEAFSTFGATSAGTTGATGFLQLAAVKKHSTVQMAAIKTLQKVHSARAEKVVAMLKFDGNPFDLVLDKIMDMETAIKEEEKADQEQFDWCKSEREESTASIESNNDQILTLEGEINTLTDTISAPDSGLEAMLAEAEDDKATNFQNQADETDERTKENLAYQADKKNLIAAQDILTKAINVLEKYYTMQAKKLAEDTSLLQRRRQTPPSTWDKGYKGESSKGNEVLDMLNFILDETAKEEETADKEEAEAVAAFDDSMAELKSEEADLEKSIAELTKTLAEKNAELDTKQKERKEAKAEVKSLEKYMEKIKPGCDFIEENIDKRKKDRAAEMKAFETSVDLIKNSPIFANAEAAAHEEELGECAPACKEFGEAHVKCKACLAGIEVSGYCASHEGTEGC